MRDTFPNLEDPTVPVIDLAGRSPAQKQGLLSQLVVPRPIAMITSTDPDGVVNVAPFSYYMPVCGEPPTVAVTIGTRREATDAPKDTWANIHNSGEFVINVTTTAIAEHIETAGREYPHDVDECAVTGWSTIASHVVAPPSLAQSPAHLECRVLDTIHRGDPRAPFSGVHIVLAEVVCIDVDESLLAEPGRVDPTAVHAVGRMGYPWFVTASPGSIFSQDRVAYADLPSATG